MPIFVIVNDVDGEVDRAMTHHSASLRATALSKVEHPLTHRPELHRVIGPLRRNRFG